MNWLERLEKEKAVIKAAPLSFAVVSLIILIGVGLTFNYIYSQRLSAKDDTIKNYADKLGLSPNAGTGPDLDVFENTITPTHSIHHVRAGLIKNITVPPGFNSGIVYLIPDGVVSTDVSGNIRNSFAASVGQVILASYDGRKWSLLQSPFTETGSTLTSPRDVRARSFETTEPGNGYLQMTELTTGNKLVWSVGRDAPTGACVTGSMYTRSVGGTGSTLYVCEASVWAAK